MTKASIITITPDKARVFLTRNVNNRPVRKSVINDLKNAILRGEWKVTHQGIAFSESGVLIDGQHRLMAIIEANKPIDTMVTIGVGDDTFKVIDTLTPRRLSDSINVSKKLGEVVNVITKISYYCDLGQKVTGTQAEPIAIKVAPVFERLESSSSKFISPSPAKAFVCYLAICSDYGDYAIDLYNKLIKREFNKLPLVATALVRKLTRPTITKPGIEGQKQFIAVADLIYRPENSYKNQIRVRDANDIIKEMQDDLIKVFPDIKPCNARGNVEL